MQVKNTAAAVKAAKEELVAVQRHVAEAKMQLADAQSRKEEAAETRNEEEGKGRDAEAEKTDHETVGAIDRKGKQVAVEEKEDGNGLIRATSADVVGPDMAETLDGIVDGLGTVLEQLKRGREGAGLALKVQAAAGEGSSSASGEGRRGGDAAVAFRPASEAKGPQVYEILAVQVRAKEASSF